VLALASPNAALTVGYLAIAGGLIVAGLWWIAALLLVIVILLMLTAAIPSYIGVCLRYDTTWYVMSERSMRLRSGIWVIQETTITFENVQNVSITQGPLERAFGIATLVVDTAGGGGEHAKGRGPGGHRGTIEGVTDAERLRRLILQRLNASRSAGLGEDAPTRGPLNPVWDDAHLGVLREIRDELQSSKYKVQSSK